TTASYGAGLRKFHIFCDVFSIPEQARLPASFELLHSFVLWAASDPDHCPAGTAILAAHRFEPVSVSTVRKYLSAIRAWHIVQGWSPPLSAAESEHIEWSLRGLQNLFGQRKRPLRPPVTIEMLNTLRSSLDLAQPFHACIWAAATSAFWGLMRFGEVSVSSRTAFDGCKHIKRSDLEFKKDLDQKPYARLSLPTAKTATPGEIQVIVLAAQPSILCPVAALHNLHFVVPAAEEAPMFSWRDSMGRIQPLVKRSALKFINGILLNQGFGTTFGHSFRIGGASFLLAQKVDPEIVRLAGRWRSLAYEAYIRAFELVASRHIGGLSL
ncbi:hypothetical protein BDQ17DRAFT_1245244, partial [Cyathus striatus]